MSLWANHHPDASYADYEAWYDRLLDQADTDRQAARLAAIDDEPEPRDERGAEPWYPTPEGPVQ